MRAFVNDRGEGPLPSVAHAGTAPPYGERLWRWLACFASPPERWGGPHQLLSWVTLAAAAFAIGMPCWRAAGIGEAAGSGASLTELERRVEDARAALARLPALRESAQKPPSALAGAASRSPTAQWQAISSLAARSGMTLRSLEPGAPTGDGIRAVRHVRIAARANFAAFFAFLQGLPTLPSLVVPVAMQIGRAEQGLAIDATLQVFDALPAAPYRVEAPPVARDDGPGWFADPFSASGAGLGAAADGLRLVGLMHAQTHGLALFETENGATVYVPGQAIGAERIVSIDARGVTLASDGARRVVTLAKEAS
jgi:hypothetical protein